MLRTQISLTEEERALLDAEAERTNRSMSALIRYAVTETFGAGGGREADLAAIRAASGAWAGRGATPQRPDAPARKTRKTET